MAKTSMEIVMSNDLKSRLHAAAKQTGKTAQEFAQEALYTYVEDVEDGVMAEAALGEDGFTYPHAEGAKAVGLDRSVFEVSRKTA